MIVKDDDNGQGHRTEDFLGLSEAAQKTPGRPTTNCVWRWCDKGIRIRSGERVKLRHIRVGGKIFTTLAWLHEFWAALANREGAYSDAKVAAGVALPPRESRFSPPRRRRERPVTDPRTAQRHRDDIEAELDAEGL